MSTASFDVPDVSGAHRTGGPSAYRDEDFPGCESFHLPASGLEHTARTTGGRDVKDALSSQDIRRGLHPGAMEPEA